MSDSNFPKSTFYIALWSQMFKWRTKTCIKCSWCNNFAAVPTICTFDLVRPSKIFWNGYCNWVWILHNAFPNIVLQKLSALLLESIQALIRWTECKFQKASKKHEILTHKTNVQFCFLKIFWPLFLNNIKALLARHLCTF